MGTNCAPLLADLFLYSYEAEFIQTLIKVSGPFVETPRIFLCMQNINYAEILA